MTYTQVADRTTVTSHHQPARGRGWTFAGIAAGIGGITGIAASMTIDAVYDESLAGLLGAVLGGLTLVLGISPLQYMAGMTGPLWLLVTALGFAAADRSAR